MSEQDSFWDEQRQKALDKRLYRASRLAAHKNPDYLSRHADEAREFATNGKSPSASKRLSLELEKRMKDVTPVVFPIRKRMNRQ